MQGAMQVLIPAGWHFCFHCVCSMRSNGQGKCPECGRVSWEALAEIVARESRCARGKKKHVTKKRLGIDWKDLFKWRTDGTEAPATPAPDPVPAPQPVARKELPTLASKRQVLRLTDTLLQRLKSLRETGQTGGARDNLSKLQRLGLVDAAGTVTAQGLEALGSKCA